MEDDRESINSSVIFKERKPLKSINRVISLTQEEYECLTRILTTAPLHCTYRPLYWMMKCPPHDWDSIMRARGQQFVLPMARHWLGLLKLNLIKEGLPSASELYEKIFEVFLSVRDASESLKLLSFLLFTNVGRGRFQVAYCRGLNMVFSTIASKRKLGVSLKTPRASFLSRIEMRWEALMNSIEAGIRRSLQSANSTLPFEFKDRDISSVLDKALEQEPEERIEYLEGISSYGFQLELEKAFVYVAHQLQEERTDFDNYYLKHELYNDEQSSSSLELRRDLLESIGESLEEFIDSQCHEILFEDKVNVS